MVLEKTSAVVTLYVVYRDDLKKFFAGFNSETSSAEFTDDVKLAKKFSNKFDIKLRPAETLCSVQIDLSNAPFSVSEPFRPARKKIAKPT